MPKRPFLLYQRTRWRARVANGPMDPLGRHPLWTNSVEAVEDYANSCVEQRAIRILQRCSISIIS